MSLWNRFPSLSLPSKVKRVLLPSLGLAFLGLLGLMSWKWLLWRRKKTREYYSAAVPSSSERKEVTTTEGEEGRGSQLRKTREPFLPISAHQEELPPHLLHGLGTTSPVPRSSSTVLPLAPRAGRAPCFVPDVSEILPPYSSKYRNVSSDRHSEGFSEAESLSSSEELLYTKSQGNAQGYLDDKYRGSELIGKPIKRSSLSDSASPPYDQLTDSQLQDESYLRSPSLFSTPGSEGPKIKVTILIPKDLVGRFIGKQGRNIKTLMSDSSAHVYINQRNIAAEATEVPCYVQGNSTQVDHALKLISIKFPGIEIPNWLDEGFASQSTLGYTPFGSPAQGNDSWDTELKPFAVPPSPFYAIVSYIESLRRVWLVSYENRTQLDELHRSMSYFYSSATSAAPEDNLVGKYCAVKVSDIHWLRGYMTKFIEEEVNYEVQLVDYGSSVIVPPMAIKPLM